MVFGITARKCNRKGEVIKKTCQCVKFREGNKTETVEKARKVAS